MNKKKEITISREKFHNTFFESTKDLVTDPVMALMFSIAANTVECALFCKSEEDKPFKVDDMCFVIDNAGDDNKLVNQIVAVREVCDDCCIVSNENIKQVVNFENLRNIKNS